MPDNEGAKMAVQDVLDHLDGDWKGQISIIRPKVWRREIQIHLHFEKEDMVGRGFILWMPEDGDPVKETFQILQKDGEASLSSDYSLYPEIGNDSQGEPNKRSILLSDLHPTSPHFLNMTFIGDTRMDMLLAGQWLMPQSMYSDLGITDNLTGFEALDGEPVYHQVGQLRKEGFRLKIGPFELVIMEFVGIFATLFFASRFVIQWIASERAKRSVMPELFWWVSLIGSGLMLIYAIYFGRLAVLLGQLTGWTVYVRNIWLIEREKRQRRHEAQEQK